MTPAQAMSPASMIQTLRTGSRSGPVRNVWIIDAGLIACAGVIPLALICGEIRGIPFYWRLIDCSFGVLGALPLWWLRRMIRELEKARG